jgi:sugar phosphate isomerase/epimerase
MNWNRREFLQTGSGVLAGAAAGVRPALASSGSRKFAMSLNPFAIGVETGQEELVKLGHRHGFEAVIAIPQSLAGMTKSELSQLLGEMKEKKIGWGSAGLPVEFRRDEQRFRDDMKKLPGLCKALEDAGVTRVGTWIMPSHAELTYVQNLREHSERLREAGKILADHNLRLGLEYVGPRTLMLARRFPFVRSLAETRDLIHEIGQENVAVQLDSFHWYCADETVDDLLTLKNEDVVLCDLNDARPGFEIEEQIDGKRELPSATGVIDLKAFLGALVQIGFDGPVRAEPFNAELNALDNELALSKTAAAMKKSFDLVGG